jgi:hypothetical protein
VDQEELRFDDGYGSSREFYFVGVTCAAEEWMPDSDRLEFTLEYFEGGFCVYQCTRTPGNFRSKNYKLKEFKASNGVILASKNSPVLISPELIFFQGAYEDFALKPNIYYCQNQHTFYHMCEGIRFASDEFIKSIRT